MDENIIHILFVEDEPDLNVLINLSLEYTDGIEAEVVPSAEDAIKYLETHKVDAIVSDHYLPKMLGIDLLVYVKEKYPKISRFLLTGSIQNEVFQRANKEAEPLAIFEKPLIIQDIIEEVLKKLQ